jgi:recombination protein RecR
MNKMGTALNNSYTRLVELFCHLPGIGEKTANRLAMYLLRSSGDYALTLADAIEQAKAKIRFCRLCQDLTEEELCRICRNERRDPTLLCIVEEPVSMAAIEQTGQYQGRYHILHGSLSPLQAIGPETLQLDRLRARISNGSQIQEVILALNSDPEGEATALYLKEYLQDVPVRVTRIATGVPVGSHVEYSDPITLSRALANRHEMGS